MSLCAETKSFVDELFEGLKTKVYETPVLKTSIPPQIPPPPVTATIPVPAPAPVVIKTEPVIVKAEPASPTHSVTQPASASSSTHSKLSANDPTLRRTKKGGDTPPSWVSNK